MKKKIFCWPGRAAPASAGCALCRIRPLWEVDVAPKLIDPDWLDVGTAISTLFKDEDCSDSVAHPSLLAGAPPNCVFTRETASEYPSAGSRKKAPALQLRRPHVPQLRGSKKGGAQRP